MQRVKSKTNISSKRQKKKKRRARQSWDKRRFERELSRTDAIIRSFSEWTTTARSSQGPRPPRGRRSRDKMHIWISWNALHISYITTVGELPKGFDEMPIKTEQARKRGFMLQWTWQRFSDALGNLNNKHTHVSHLWLDRAIPRSRCAPCVPTNPAP